MASASSLDISAYNYAYTRHRMTWQYNWSTRKYDFLSDALFATYTGSAQTFRKERTWTRTDNYRTLKAAGVRLPDNDFTYTESKSSTMSGQCHGPFAYADWKQYQTQYRFPSFTHNVAVDPTARVDANKVYAKLVARVKGAQFNTPVFLAESRQTATWLYSERTRLCMVSGPLDVETSTGSWIRCTGRSPLPAGKLPNGSSTWFRPSAHPKV